MNFKNIIPCMYLYDGKPGPGQEQRTPFRGYDDAAELAAYYRNAGADILAILDLTSDNDTQHDNNINCMTEIVRVCDIPVMAGGIVKRFEDIKKYLYTGAKAVLIFLDQSSDFSALKEGATRFGKEKLYLCLEDIKVLMDNKEIIEDSISGIFLLNADRKKLDSIKETTKLPVIPSLTAEQTNDLMDCLKQESVIGLSGTWTEDTKSDLMAFKFLCKASGISMNLLESKIKWNELKLNSDNMIPVIAQDYKTDEVLMLAYMNEEAFQETAASGKMTYWSRSRNELWKKGLTSGHFQYVKSLTADCDKDTILAKVFQLGAACHTGRHSCFFNEMIKTEYDEVNPLKVFTDVYQTILDRKEHPKPGSYTNYLFDKGIDKILKKVGEEATEIVIAAKNPDAQEIKYEISDFLYHVMVLMAERGVTWEDITEELSHR